MATIQTASLGDKAVRRVGFGAMQLAGPGVFGPPKDPDAARAGFELLRSDRVGQCAHLSFEPRVLRVVAQHRYPCTILGGQRPWLAAAISASSRAVCLRFWRGS